MTVLGCIADDFTGATDLAGNLVASGRRTVVTIGVPEGPLPDVDAIVVALKTRTVPAVDAVRAALEAHQALRERGCTRFWFKYCSTFDSTPRGNIGPVLDALLEATGAPWTIACPAYPANDRTVYQGHLFVGQRLLSETGMRVHPLTPMTDADLVRVLSAQTRHPVGLLPHAVLRAGPAATHAHIGRLRDGGARVLVTDSIDDTDLTAVEQCSRDLPLVTGGAGLALALPPGPAAAADTIPIATGPMAVLAGSVSETTLAQTAHARPLLPHRKVAVAHAVTDPAAAAGALTAWARPHLDAGRGVLVHSADTRDDVRAAQAEFGAERVAQALEATLAACARGLADSGVRRFLIAGGETSGAVVSALDVRGLAIGPAIAPGISWTSADHWGRTVNLALKSGNFGPEDLFTTAEAHL
ncbi:four-carbon acid sugar kinase family protein [Streptomyces sp. Lzd4kr]|nr:four-carbon acid sugar kinase family protein [Streptomyces sp. Lzd4kr]